MLHAGESAFESRLQTIFSLLYNVQIGSGVHPASCSTGIMILSRVNTVGT
jgi:hypothetical protein